MAEVLPIKVRIIAEEVVRANRSEAEYGSAKENYELKLEVGRSNREQEGGVVEKNERASSTRMYLSDDAMTITLSASYKLWEDDDSFEVLIENLRCRRQNGLKMRKESW